MYTEQNVDIEHNQKAEQCQIHSEYLIAEAMSTKDVATTRGLSVKYESVQE